MAQNAMKRLRLFFYVQHLLGIGHLVRSSRIADALAEGGFEITLAAGGMAVDGFPGPGILRVALPPIRATAGFAGLEDADGKPVGETLKAERRELLLDALHKSRPDAVLIEAFPFGRRQMRFELLPLLKGAHKMRPRPLVASSIRDILQESRKPERIRESADTVKKYFDLVLVHGDPSFAKLEETFPLTHEIAEKIEYTGMVAGSPPQATTEQFDIVASIGGGAAGADLVRCVIEAAGQLPTDLRWCLLTGPNLPPGKLLALQGKAPSNLHIADFRQDFSNLLGGARLSISQAGYNTVCDLLQARCRCLLIPFAAGGESEQTIRARRLEARGLAKVLTEEELNAATLAGAVVRSLNSAAPPESGLQLAGTEKTREILRHRLAKD
jgi:predicted glycosyltransferase